MIMKGGGRRWAEGDRIVIILKECFFTFKEEKMSLGKEYLFILSTLAISCHQMNTRLSTTKDKKEIYMFYIQ